MTNDSSLNQPEPDNSSSRDPELRELVSEWQFAKIRYDKLREKETLRREGALVLSLLALVFAGPYVLWFKRWMAAGSIQSYAVAVIPVVCFWVWAARYKLVLPEVDPIRRALRYERRSRVRSLKLGERSQTVLRFLVDEKPVMDRRYKLLLVVACIVDVAAFWVRDPTLLGLGFVLTAGGIVLYRFGIYAFRAALFPFLLMFTMIPLPGLAVDAAMDKFKPIILGVAQHTMTNWGTLAEIPLEGDPLVITTNGIVYRLFADKAGLGISEMILVLILTVTYLSLTRMKNPLPKLIAMLASIVWMAVLVSARLILLCVVATSDREVAGFLEGITRPILIVVGCAGCYALARGLKCVKLHRWVSF